MRFTAMIKLKGLNGRQIAVNGDQVVHLSEIDNDGRLVCNVHFANGTFVTAGVSLEETYAVLHPKKDDVQTADDKVEMDRWRRMAEAKRRCQIEIDTAIKMSEIDMERFRRGAYHVETAADGSKCLKITLEPRPTQSVDEDGGVVGKGEP